MRITKEKKQHMNELGILYSELVGEKNTLFAFHFDSFSEMLDKLELAKKLGWSIYKNKHIDDEWTYGSLKSRTVTEEYLRKGIATELQISTAKKFADEVNNLPEVRQVIERASSIMRKKVFKEDGSELCIDRVMAGDPAHWQLTTKGAKRPLIKIGININGTADESEKRFASVCSLGAVISDLFQKAGFSTEIYSCSTSMSMKDSDLASVLFKIKSADQVIDIQNVCAVGVTGLFRSYVFTIRGNALSRDGGSFSSCPIPLEFQNQLGLDYVIDADVLLNSDYSAVKAGSLEKLFQEVIQKNF